MALTPAQRRLYQIFHPPAATQQASAFAEGTRFVYYTRAETAMSILKNRQLRALSGADQIARAYLRTIR